MAEITGPGIDYTCAICHGEFKSTRSDDEAMAEAEARYGGPISDDEKEVVCDDCHIKFMRWFDSLTPEQHREIQAEASSTLGTGGPAK